MGKYDAWGPLFQDLTGEEVEFDFEYLSSLVPGGLPDSAYRYAEWWSNTHHHAVWTDHGWYVSVDIDAQIARFSRTKSRRGRPSRSSSTPDVSVKEFPQGVRLILLGCVSSKLSHPAPARDLYVSDLWRKRRAYAESTGMPWAILSAEYGLVEPNTVIEPYDRSLANEAASYAERWAGDTGRKIVEMCRTLGVEAVEAHAGAAYLERGLIAALNDAGIRVYWPLRGLRIGEQLETYSKHSQQVPTYSEEERAADTELAGALRRIAQLEAEVADLRRLVSRSAPTVDVSAAALSLDRKRQIAREILDFGRRADPVTGEAEALIFTPMEEADRLIRTDPFAFLLGVIFDQGITAERAWEGPWLLKQRIGHLDPARIARSAAEVQRAVSEPPSLHRYIEIVPGWIVLAAEKVLGDYGGDASAIWSDHPTVDMLRARLEEFKGIGVKKSAMAVEMLERDLGVQIRGMDRSDVAYDVHLRRVFIRTGLAERDEIDHMTAVARQVHPERPGELDLPTWMIGREWCHPGVPDCPTCVLDEVCDHRIAQGSAVKGV